MELPDANRPDLLEQSLASDRIHSGYLITGQGSEARETALRFARALVCTGEEGQRPCEACSSCRRSPEGDKPIPLDGKGKSGPHFRHIGGHPDLFWVERGRKDTRIRIDQVRELQAALRLHPVEGGRRAVVLHQAQFMNAASQNALLRVLEEPPPNTTLILVADSASSLLITIRSRCQRIDLPPPPTPTLDDPDTPEEVRALALRLDALEETGLPGLLDWAAADFRGVRQTAAAEVEVLLDTSSRWLRERVEAQLAQGQRDLSPELEAFSNLASCRRALITRNANPQMIAERALLALRAAVAQ